MSQPNRTPDFRYLFANSFGLQMNNNEVTVRFGYSEDVTRPEESILEQVGIIFTPASAKLLGITLTSIMESFERDTGTTIAVDDAKLAELKAAMKATPVAAPKAPPKRR